MRAKTENKGVCDYLAEWANGPGIVHPDLSDHMRSLASNLPGMSFGSEMRADVIRIDGSGVIVAVAIGTAYSLKVGSHFEAAVASGAKTSHHWSTGGTLDLSKQFGPDWIVGSWSEQEITWVKNGNA